MAVNPSGQKIVREFGHSKVMLMPARGAAVSDGLDVVGV